MAKVQEQIVEGQLVGPINGAIGLVRRYQEVQGFRVYVRQYLPLILPIVALMMLTSIGCSVATILFIGGTQATLVLLAMLLVPFVLVGSLFVQLYVFFSWLESRAIAKALHHDLKRPGPLGAALARAGFEMGTLPPVPWVLAALFVLLPLLMLLNVLPLFAAALIVLHVAGVLVFARLDPLKESK